jgi:hypothetical protein
MLLFLVLVFGGAATVFAQSKGAAKGISSIQNAPTIQELEEMVIEGKIQKPEVFYILSRSETKYLLPQRKESFERRVIQSVEKNPF